MLLQFYICVNGVKPSWIQIPAVLFMHHCGQVMLTSLECQFPCSVNGDILISVEGLLQELFLQQILTEPSRSARYHSKAWEIQP